MNAPTVVPPQAMTEDTDTRNWCVLRLDVLQRIKKLPSFGPVVTEFLALARRDNYTARDFEKVLAKDQGLVARLLKTANASIFGRARNVTTIPQAVVLIGLQHLTRMVYTVSSEGLIRQGLDHYSYHPEQGFWQHGLGVAHASSVVAEAIPDGALYPEEAYVAGLLHDLAKLVLDEFLETPEGLPVGREQEVAAVGLDHAELAAYILEQWNLPSGIIASIRYHHDYRAAGPWLKGAGALHLGHEICAVWGIGFQRPYDLSQDIPAEHFAAELDELGIPASRWDQIIWDTRQRLVSLGEFTTGT